MQKPLEKVVRKVFFFFRFQLIIIFCQRKFFNLFFIKIEPLCMFSYIFTWPRVQRYKMKLKHLRKAFQSLKLLPVGLNYSSFLRASQIYFHILSSESSVQMLKWGNTRYKKGKEEQLQGRSSSCKKIIPLSHGGHP